MILAQEILVDFAHYPTPRIAANSHEFRPLGLGYANLGALLMSDGLPYDSAEGRAYAGAITALMCGEAYLASARIAEAMGPFPGYPVNRESMLEVIAMHRDAAHRIPTRGVTPDLRKSATEVWDSALEHGRAFGYRNSQVTVLAPTGTIGFMMDCDTTGIEPDLALVKIKRLVGGGTIKIVNQTVPRALAKLGYDEPNRTVILRHLETTGTIEGAPGLKDEHLPVFDCAFKAVSGSRFISPLGHLRMMGAAQPFLSGAISKTVNVPEETGPEEIEKLYVEGWKLGLKSAAVYRDNCKGSQPLAAAGEKVAVSAFQPVRRKLPDERVAITHKFSVEGQEGYVTVGLYEDRKPGELFITMAKEGSTLSGVMDAFATAISLTLQYGVPLEFLVNKFSHVRFEPAGWTNNPQIPYAKSIIDYIFRWLASKFLAPEDQAAVGVQPVAAGEDKPQAALPGPRQQALPGLESGEISHLFVNQADAPPCPTCGMMMVRAGACYKCGNCGTVHGCS
jgi:ribonucleoside-diphosphate reductase alpha chain